MRGNKNREADGTISWSSEALPPRLLTESRAPVRVIYLTLCLIARSGELGFMKVDRTPREASVSNRKVESHD